MFPEPVSVKEALESEHAAEWRAAMDEEISNLLKFGCFETRCFCEVKMGGFWVDDGRRSIESYLGVYRNGSFSSTNPVSLWNNLGRVPRFTLRPHSPPRLRQEEGVGREQRARARGREERTVLAEITRAISARALLRLDILFISQQQLLYDKLPSQSHITRT